MVNVQLPGKHFNAHPCFRSFSNSQNTIIICAHRSRDLTIHRPVCKVACQCLYNGIQAGRHTRTAHRRTDTPHPFAQSLISQHRSFHIRSADPIAHRIAKDRHIEAHTYLVMHALPQVCNAAVAGIVNTFSCPDH